MLVLRLVDAIADGVQLPISGVALLFLYDLLSSDLHCLYLLLEGLGSDDGLIAILYEIGYDLELLYQLGIPIQQHLLFFIRFRVEMPHVMAELMHYPELIIRVVDDLPNLLSHSQQVPDLPLEQLQLQLLLSVPAKLALQLTSPHPFLIQILTQIVHGVLDSDQSVQSATLLDELSLLR